MDSKPLLPAEHTHTTRNTPEARTCVINRAHFSPLQPPPLPFFVNLICCRFDRISMSSYCSCLHMVSYVYLLERRCPYSSCVCSGHFIGGLFQGVSSIFFFGVSYTDRWGYVYFAALKCLAGDYDKGSAWLMWFCVGDEAHCNGSSPLLPWPHVTWPCSESWNQGPDAYSWLPDYFKSLRPSACNYKPSVIG